MMSPGEIREIRIKLGLSIQEIADKLGVNRDTYSKWERGKQRIPAIGETAMKWLSANRII